MRVCFVNEKTKIALQKLDFLPGHMMKNDFSKRCIKNEMEEIRKKRLQFETGWKTGENEQMKNLCWLTKRNDQSKVAWINRQMKI